MSSKTEKPKVKETLAEDFRPDPQKIFRHLNSCQKLSGLLGPIYFDRSELLACLSLGILRQQIEVIRNEVGSVDRHKIQAVFSSNGKIGRSWSCTGQPGRAQADGATSIVLKLHIYTCHGWEDRVLLMILFPSVK